MRRIDRIVSSVLIATAAACSDPARAETAMFQGSAFVEAATPTCIANHTAAIGDFYRTVYAYSTSSAKVDSLSMIGGRAATLISSVSGSLNGAVTTTNAVIDDHASLVGGATGSANLAIASVGGLPTLQAVNLKLAGTIDNFFAVTGCNITVHAQLVGIGTRPDPVAGAVVYRRCAACHEVGVGAREAIGPILNGIVGRQAGSDPNYNYSNAMKASGLVWSETTLGAFIQNPSAVVPGTKMVFSGLSDQSQIGDLVAYLKSFGPDGRTP